MDEDQRAVGLLMNYNLDRKLGSRFGISLYFKREISRLMDPSPLVADINEPVEEVAKLAMNREDFKIYDDIVVTEHGRFAGTVSVQKMLDFLAEVQVKIAMGANPLSGLPGNVAIEQEISRRATGRIASSLIYIDLDNFKVFNDAYGFENGDQLILFTAKLLRNAIRNSGREDDFIGHVGGDDFVIISSQKRATALSETITRMFEAGVVRFYEPEDREEGYIMGKGRDGVKRKFPIVSVSIGIVDCDFQTEFSMNDLSHRVAEIKKYAKSIPGNSYVKDRRQPLGSCENQPDFGKGFYHEE